MGKNHNSSLLLLLTAGVSVVLIFIEVDSLPDGYESGRTLNPKSHGIRIQPELDKIDIDKYLKNTKAVNIQVKCLIWNGPCDWVGRWLKPRVAAALLGECLLCTEHQKEVLPKIMNFIHTNYPNEFNLGIRKYLLDFGITIPSQSEGNEEINNTETTTLNKISSTQISFLSHNSSRLD